MRKHSQVSVVIPLYNKVTTIHRALNSVFAQNLGDLEIIVVDDGSTDGSLEAVQALADSRITLVTQPNAGPGSARNVGAAMAQGELLAFLDADDEWSPEYLATGVHALNSHPSAIAYASSFDTGTYSHLVPDKVSKIVSAPMVLPPPATEVGEQSLMNRLHGLHSSSTIVRRSAFERAGGFYARERCLWGEDSYLWGQILFFGPIYWDPTPRIRYHVADSSLGFAVTYRNQARPLSLLRTELNENVPPENWPAFGMVSRGLVAEDAATLAGSGYIFRAIALRLKYRAFTPKDIFWDIVRFARFLKIKFK